MAAGPLRIQRCTNDSAVDVSGVSADTDYDEAKASRRSDYYFAFFLFYPSMTQSFFNHFNCRQLSPTLWVLQKDYSEECYEGWCAPAARPPPESKPSKDEFRCGIDLVRIRCDVVFSWA